VLVWSSGFLDTLLVRFYSSVVHTLVSKASNTPLNLKHTVTHQRADPLSPEFQSAEDFFQNLINLFQVQDVIIMYESDLLILKGEHTPFTF
jgi:hypothetical protein